MLSDTDSSGKPFGPAPTTTASYSWLVTMPKGFFIEANEANEENSGNLGKAKRIRMDPIECVYTKDIGMVSAKVWKPVEIVG
ncbi:MAG TPA: hypothetical protein VF020_20930, partial [Chthoniobacterales bacterium]